jgi:hypothetical protein
LKKLGEGSNGSDNEDILPNTIVDDEDVDQEVAFECLNCSG